MGKILRNIAVVALSLLSFTGCFKKVTLETTLHIKPLVEKVSGGGRLTAKCCYAYLYYNVSETDTIMSYEDAAARIITNKLTGEKRSVPDVASPVVDADVAEFVDDALGSVSIDGLVDGPWVLKDSKTEYISLEQKQPSALVVVVYPAAKMYAYMHRKSEAENLPDTYLTLIFHRWKAGKPYNEGSKEGYKWIVFPPEEPATPEPEQPIEPETPEGDESEPSTNN